MLRKILIGLAVFIALVFVWNASWRVTPPADAKVALIAHRGVHQTFDNNGLGNDGCSAERIETPTHGFFENTLPSMEAAFAAGADIVEFDIHPTTDGQLAVLHDWTLDCHTEASGVTREQSMAFLKTLDIAYGYTADGGKTFPFRGQGVGMMPELREVLAAFPEGRFLVNFKSNELREADMLAAVVNDDPVWRAEIWGVYGGDPPTMRAQQLLGIDNAWTRKATIDCVTQYAGLGWTGYVPGPCHNTRIMLPINVAPWLWGWPNLLLERMHAAGSEVILLGAFEAGDPGTSGIDTLEELAKVPQGFDGYIWTNRIEVIGPALKGTPEGV
ncbi:Glycerophosphoryl diester phosphodiesterase [Devosia sp. H5989]|nr:Glycerophosphoryl diester phosphodiesterase [Devosia sp. H5989]